MKKVYIVIGTLFLISGGAVATNLIATDHNHAGNNVVAHSGGTNSQGCHNDHIHGGYHCH